MPEYVSIAKDRISQAIGGTLRVREMNTPVYDPQKAGNSLTINPWQPLSIEGGRNGDSIQNRLFQDRKLYVVEP